MNDIPKRPFILVGTAALAADGAAGGDLVQPRHQGPRRGALAGAAPSSVYAIVLLGLLHFFWMRSAKNNFGEVAIYAVIIAVLLGWRLWRRVAATRSPRLSTS